MDEDQLAALHSCLSILHRMVAALDMNYGRLEVLTMIDPQLDVVARARSWEKYTLSCVGSLGLAISAVADGDSDRLDLIMSMLKEWEDSDG